MKIVIVGGVAGGASAAAKARRCSEDAEIILFERGPYISFANCGLPYFIGGVITDKSKLNIMTPELFWTKYRVRADVHSEVLRIDRAQQEIEVRAADGSIQMQAYDKLILAQGAQPFKPDISGIDFDHVFTLRDIPQMEQIDDYIREQQPKKALIIGGGFIGLEMAEAFHLRGLAVTVVERNAHIMAALDADIAKEFTQYLENDQFRLIADSSVVEIQADKVVLNDGTTLAADMVLASAGVRPEVALAKDAGLELGVTGGVKVNSRMQSTDRNIYAVGDAAEIAHSLTGQRVRVPLAGPANRQGRIAGANAAGHHKTYAGTQGTAIVHVLGYTVALTGLSTKQATKAGLTFVTSTTRDPSHATYYPGAEMIVTRLIIEEGRGRILGAQVLGKDGVDKRLDVLATAIKGGLTVFDLEELDLAYAPPFGSANDPVNFAGFVASHIIQGDVSAIDTLREDIVSDVLLDVRNADEIEQHGALQGSIHIPHPQLRDRLSEIESHRKSRIVVYCQKGQRGYLATRILLENGFENVHNISGGYLQARLNIE